VDRRETETHINSVYRYALQMLRSVPEAEDIAQEVFILAWLKRTKIGIVDQSVLPWLLVTTRNLSLNRIKKADRDERTSEDRTRRVKRLITAAHSGKPRK
jgi:DNA-directed RNA polymerase specialized sigma24 family protein